MTTTHIACLTPAGTGAIATMALRGPAVWQLLRELAQRELPPNPQLGRFWLTSLGETGAADEVVVAVKQTTPEPWIELHCHGGREVVRLLTDLFSQRGAEIVTWQQLERAANADPFRAAALDVLVNAPTARTAAIALDQYHGAFTRAIETVRESLRRGDTCCTERLLADLEQFAPVGRHLNVPWRVVIAGAPNVGKSSLVNALAGYQRSIVSPIPGTTRDLVTTLLAFDGWPAEVTDTAGLRNAHALLENEGVARAQQAMASADLCLWLLDASVAPIFPDANLGTIQIVINKVDLPPAWSLDQVAALRVSAQMGTGLQAVCNEIASRLVPRIPPPGASLPFTPTLAADVEQLLALTRAEKLPEALEKLERMRRECD